MFYYYQAHSLKKLANTFSEIVAKTTDPLKPLWIVVQNNEIKEWLTIQCAKQQGIFANTRFIFPSEFIWALYRIGHKDVPNHLPSDRTAIHWQMFKLFQDKPELLEMIPTLAHHEIEEKVLFQFCTQMADVFDQYQVYRPEMTEKWLQNELSYHIPDEKWQADIWNLLNREWQKNSLIKNIPRRAEIFVRLKNQLKNSEFLTDIPANLYIFGLTQYSAPFLEVIASISDATNIHFFNEIFPESTKSMHAFIQDLSKPKNEQLDLLKKYLEHDNVKYGEIYEKEPNAPLPSIEVHSCHTKRREVEVLKNRILEILDQDHEIQVDDILIMVPEMQAYAKLIETIFSRDKNEPNLLVSEISTKQRNSISQAILLLTDLIGSSYKATDVLQLLSTEPIRNKLKILESDLNLIEKWIQDNSIYRGLGKESNSLYSWSRGVNQLIAGFAMEPKPLTLYNNLIPYAGIISGEQLECAAKLSNYIHLLKTAEEESKTEKTPCDWLYFVKGLIESFIPDDRFHQTQKILILKLIENLSSQIELSEYDKAISYKFFKPWLQTQLESSSSVSGRFGHGITLSTYIPYRTVPFKIIAVLGMNEGTFPRRSIRPDFDLLHKKPSPGDRILKEDDSQLFLEILFAAEKYLHISYEGFEPRSNNKKLPSVLVQQLHESLGEGNKLLHAHSLHPFNRMNFQQNHRNYSTELSAIARKLFQQDFKTDRFFSPYFQHEVIDENKFVSLGDFIDFFSNPSRYFVKNVLNAGSYKDFKILDDREIFKLSGLEQYKLDQELFNYFQKDHSNREVFEYLSASAALPEGFAGEKVYNSSLIDITKLLTELNKLRIEEEESVDIKVSVQGINFNGHISGVCGKQFISYRAGKLKGKNLAEHFIKHLFLLKAGESVNKSYFICKGEKKAIDIIEFDSIDLNADALDEYAQWYSQADKWADKLNFFPDTSMVYAERINDGDSNAQALQKAQNKWLNYLGYGDATDANVQLLWSGQEPLLARSFHENALRFWNPVFKSIKKMQKEGV